MATAPQVRQPSYVGPPFDEAHVHDAMRVGVITCRPETPLSDVARMMATFEVHSVVVQEVESPAAPWGIVSSLDIAAAAASDLTELTAGSTATTDVLTISATEPLAGAARVMAEHGVTHLVAVDQDGRPVGVISASGLAAVLAAPHS